MKKTKKKGAKNSEIGNNKDENEQAVKDEYDVDSSDEEV